MGSYTSTNKKREVRHVKFLLIWSWAPKNTREVNERFKQWKPVGDVKFLFPIHTIIGANKGFTIIDAENAEVMVRNTAPWTDICTFEFYPIIDAREAMALV